MKNTQMTLIRLVLVMMLGLASTAYGGKLVLYVEADGPRAVTGGTGEFRNVRGEMTGADLSNFPNFTVTFKLIDEREDL